MPSAPSTTSSATSPGRKFRACPEPAVITDEQVLHAGRWVDAATLPQFDAARRYRWRRPVRLTRAAAYRLIERQERALHRRRVAHRKARWRARHALLGL
jgi:hypothetical protein